MRRSMPAYNSTVSICQPDHLLVAPDHLLATLDHLLSPIADGLAPQVPEAPHLT